MDFQKVRKILKKENNLIHLKGKNKVVFVGDTHGDLETSQRVVSEYLKDDNILVFLGDYVDRGNYSKQNIDFLLEKKTEKPEQLFLLQGNHEGHHTLKFFPAEFWEGLSKKEYKIYTELVENFPLVFVAGDVMALHGALPDVESIEGIKNIKLGSDEWKQITWGDFSEGDGDYLGLGVFTGRPQFGSNYFFRVMKKLNKKVLIRSHQSNSPRFMFNDQCVTIFTSSAYQQRRSIALADLSKEISTGRDLDIILLEK